MIPNRFRFTRPWPVAGLAVIVVALSIFVACEVDAKQGDPALPSGFTTEGIPDVSLRGYIYVNTGAPVLVPARSFGNQAESLGDVNVSVIEGVLQRPSNELAARVEFTDSATATTVARLAASSARPDQWVQDNGTHLMLGRPNSGSWTSNLQSAWTEGRRAPIADAYPEAWSAIRLLPEDPPAPPIAAGFIRNLADVVEDLLSTAEVSVPGLSSAFSLMRIETAALAVYTEDVDRLSGSFTVEALREANMSALAVARAGYPGSVVGMLFPRFADRAGLEQTEVDGASVYYRDLGGDMHLVMKNFGSAFFFAIAPSRDGAEDLLRSVIASQDAR